MFNLQLSRQNVKVYSHLFESTFLYLSRAQNRLGDISAFTQMNGISFFKLKHIVRIEVGENQ